MSGPWEEREYISRYAIKTVGIVVHVDGVPTDSEVAVTVDMLQAEDESVIWSGRSTDHPAVGTYEYQITSDDSQTPGAFDLRWHVMLNSIAQTPVTFIEVGEAAPAYDALTPELQVLVDRVWVRFADVFDSVFGGPHLQTYFQAHFNRGRLAQLLHTAVGRLNTVAQPHQTYTIDGSKPFPIEQWGYLLEHALYVETIKHLIRSYVEQPDWVGVNVARADRRDYMNRWESVLASEVDDLKSELEVFKIANMGLGRPHVLISGGAYGRYGPVRLSGSVATRPRYWARFY